MNYLNPLYLIWINYRIRQSGSMIAVYSTL